MMRGGDLAGAAVCVCGGGVTSLITKDYSTFLPSTEEGDNAS